MKVSLKLREEQKPLMRAKLPLNVLGVPMFTGMTSGDQEELALHLGTHFGSGPAFRLSYKPNDVHSPFSVLAKAGIGLWGSPAGAAVALSAEVNLNSEGCPSFSVRLKPRFGDFGFKKHTRSFTAAYVTPDRIGEEIGEIGEHVKAGKSRLLESLPSASGDGNLPGLAANGHHHGNDDGPKAEVRNGTQSFSQEDSNITEHDDGEVDSEGGDSAAPALGERDLPWGAGRVREGWSMNTHSRLPLGRWAEAKARWQVKFGSDVFGDLRHGLHISDVKLPSLTIDKISFHSVDPNRNIASIADVEGFTYPYFRGGDDQLGRIVDMCSSMRYQLHLLHLENSALKNSVGDLVSRRSDRKGSDLMIQEENALRSQMFDELNGKAGGGKERSHGKRGGGDSSLDFSRSDFDFSSNSDQSEELKKAIMNAGG